MKNFIFKLNTKSNYRGLNGLWIEGVLLNGQWITGRFVDQEDQIVIEADFKLDEVSEIKHVPKLDDTVK